MRFKVSPFKSPRILGAAKPARFACHVVGCWVHRFGAGVGPSDRLASALVVVLAVLSTGSFRVKTILVYLATS